jgi:hypothetical protein
MRSQTRSFDTDHPGGLDSSRGVPWRRTTGALGLSVVIGVIACGGSVSTIAADTGESGARDSGPRRDTGVARDAGGQAAHAPDSPVATEVPMRHRPNDSGCATPPATGNCSSAGYEEPDGSSAFPCRTDGQCTQGTNGPCNTAAPIPIMGCRCDYDTCTGDADCPAGQLCVCHGSAEAFGFGNTCMPGNCRVDGDCGPHGYCSPSAETENCGSVVGYFWHTAADACVNDSDCSETITTACMWSTADGRWECQSAPGCG